MLTSMRGTGTAVASACVLVLTAAVGVAHAGDRGGVTCDHKQTSCTIDVNGGGSSGQSGGSTSGGSALGNDPCTYTLAPYQPPVTDTVDQHPGQKGGWYQVTCPDGINAGSLPVSAVSTVVWLPAPPPGPLQPSPAQLAAEAQRKLQLPAPTISSSPRPGLPQLVTVPMWAWTARSVFTSVSATASVPGKSVTATATPVSVTWSFGDGSSTTCAGPGTPFPPGGDPEVSSPDCGHTYTRSSGSGSFTVTATITWNVTWAGAGQVGSFNGMTTTASEQVRVLQSQAVVTSG